MYVCYVKYETQQGGQGRDSTRGADQIARNDEGIHTHMLLLMLLLLVLSLLLLLLLLSSSWGRLEGPGTTDDSTTAIDQ